MNQISFDDLFIEENKERNNQNIQSPLQNKVLNLLHPGKISALNICEKLIEAGHISSQRYSTNKPKAYGQVCLILENLVLQGTLVFIEDKEKNDRIYEHVQGDLG